MEKENNPYNLDTDSFQVSSTMDCTGLIPALPADEAGLESYEELYPYLPPKN